MVPIVIDKGHTSVSISLICCHRIHVSLAVPRLVGDGLAGAARTLSTVVDMIAVVADCAEALQVGLCSSFEGSIDTCTERVDVVKDVGRCGNFDGGQNSRAWAGREEMPLTELGTVSGPLRGISSPMLPGHRQRTTIVANITPATSQKQHS